MMPNKLDVDVNVVLNKIEMCYEHENRKSANCGVIPVMTSECMGCEYFVTHNEMFMALVKLGRK